MKLIASRLLVVVVPVGEGLVNCFQVLESLPVGRQFIGTDPFAAQELSNRFHLFPIGLAQPSSTT